MKIVLAVVSILFAALSAFAALSQLNRDEHRGSHLLMALGALLLAVAALGLLLDWQGRVLNASLGCAMICAAALWNGKKRGTLHPRHHVVRIALSLALVAGFLLL